MRALLHRTFRQISTFHSHGNLKQNGYEFNIRPSKNREKTGSTAQIIEIINSTKERNIKQVQVSPDGSSRHGNVPYVKISTSNEGKIKVIDGTREQYVLGDNFNLMMIDLTTPIIPYVGTGVFELNASYDEVKTLLAEQNISYTEEISQPNNFFEYKW